MTPSPGEVWKNRASNLLYTIPDPVMIEVFGKPYVNIEIMQGNIDRRPRLYSPEQFIKNFTLQGSPSKTPYKASLSPAERERLVMLAEECSEVIKLVCKVERFGPHSHHPDDPDQRNNLHLLRQEMIDVSSCIQHLIGSGDIDPITFVEIDASLLRRSKFMRHQNE